MTFYAEEHYQLFRVVESRSGLPTTDLQDNIIFCSNIGIELVHPVID